MSQKRGRKTAAPAAAGQITVFFALTLCLVFALLLGILESARTQGARLYFTQAVNSAMDSLFSQYHRKLWEDYRLLGLEHYEEQQLCDEMERFLSPYLGASDWYPEELGEITVEDRLLLTELDGELFEREVLDYMKYGIFESLWDYGTAVKMLADIGEAGALDRVSDLYEDHTKEAVRLEKAIEDLNQALTEQKEHYESALAAVERLSGGSFIHYMQRMQEALRQVPKLVQAYEEQADRLAQALGESRQRYEAEKESLSEAVRGAMESDIREYESYVNEDGARRQQIAALPEKAEANAAFLDSVIAEAEAAEAYIASWEPADEDDELDEEAVWAPVRRHFLEYELLQLSAAHGVADKEKEGFLEQVSALLKGHVLELLLPEGVSVSKDQLELSDAPSATAFSGTNGCRLSLTERVLMGEYGLQSFHYFGRDRYGKRPETRGSGHMEIEYILNGKENDYENLSDTVMSLLAMREGLNLIYLFTDTEKRSEARALAAVITGVAGFTPLIAVMTFFILGVWALGQALCDVRDLLGGKEVPFLHSRQSFYLTLEGLLSIGSSNGVLPEGGGQEGFSYREYLRILLFYGQSSLYDYRMMDMIQMNVKSGQQDFLLTRCIYSMRMGAEAKTKHVLASLGMLGNLWPLEKLYAIRTETYFSY